MNFAEKIKETMRHAEEIEDKKGYLHIHGRELVESEGPNMKKEISLFEFLTAGVSIIQNGLDDFYNDPGTKDDTKAAAYVELISEMLTTFVSMFATALYDVEVQIDKIIVKDEEEEPDGE